MDDGADTGFIGSLTDQPTEIRCVKLPVGAWCRPDLIVKLLRLRVSRMLRHRSVLRATEPCLTNWSASGA